MTVTVLHTLTGIGQGLFEVREQGQGCSCGNATGSNNCLLLLLAGWLSLVVMQRVRR